GVAVVQVGFTGQDAQPGLKAVYGSRRRKILAIDVVGIERAAAVGVFDAVQRGVGGIGDAGREMNAADETNRARRKRGLGIAEEARRTGEGDGDFIRRGLNAKVGGRSGGSGGFAGGRGEVALAVGY